MPKPARTCPSAWEKCLRAATLRAVKRSSVVVLAIALLCVAAGLFFVLRPQRSLPLDPLAAVPADAYGVLRVKVDRVLASEAYKRLVVERGGAKGIERIKARCGFNPLEGIREVVVFARPSPQGSMPRFAFTARGDLKHEALVDCVRKVGSGDGSELAREDIEGIPAVRSRRGTSRAAFIGSDGVVGGDGESVVASINAMLGKAPNLAQDAVIKDLYTQFDQGTDIAGVARMPDEVRAMLQAMAKQAIGTQVGVLTDAKAAAGSLSLSDARIIGGGLLVAASPEHAVASVMLVRSYIDRILSFPGIGLTPAASVLRSVQTDVDGDRATLTGQVKVSTVETLLELLPAFDQLRTLMSDGPSADSATPSNAAPAPEPGKALSPTVEPLKPSTEPLKQAEASDKKPNQKK